jgi:hypothetical protein
VCFLQLFFFVAIAVSFFFASVLFFKNTYNSWLQSLTQIFCNYTLVQFSFFFSCSHRNKPADFAMRHFSYLQSLTTQVCNHIQTIKQQTDKVRFPFFATHITPGCNHGCQIVAIIHWLS